MIVYPRFIIIVESILRYAKSVCYQTKAFYYTRDTLTTLAELLASTTPVGSRVPMLTVHEMS